MKQTFNDLNIKEKLAIISACGAFIMGWTLTGIAAFVPILLSEQGVLWILGQSLVYSASIFGVAAYFKAESVQMKKDINRHLENTERMIIQREKLRSGQEVIEIPEEKEDE